MQVWAYPTTDMQCEWLGERVATVDIKRAINNVIVNKEDASWGPNAVFRFPLEGGTGAIWKGVAKLLPQNKQVCCHSAACTANELPHVANLLGRAPAAAGLGYGSLGFLCCISPASISGSGSELCKLTFAHKKTLFYIPSAVHNLSLYW